MSVWLQAALEAEPGPSTSAATNSSCRRRRDKLELLDSVLRDLSLEWERTGLDPGHLLRPHSTPLGSAGGEQEVEVLRGKVEAGKCLQTLMKLVDLIFDDDKSLVTHTVEVLEKSSVVVCKGAQSGRECWMVRSARSSKPYVCMGGQHYCSCRNFFDRAKSAQPGDAIVVSVATTTSGWHCWEPHVDSLII
jgi:hypothetical protein